MPAPPQYDPATLTVLVNLVRAAIARRDQAGDPAMVVLGLSGAQGSGKSTLADALVRDLDRRQIKAATLSLDDLYLPLAARQRLAATVHPLLATRGVPGTHDIALGLDTIAALRRGEPAMLPRFDKARDDRHPQDRLRGARAPGGTQVLILEGWCLGAKPQPATDLATPVNVFEQVEDRGGHWRRHANAALAGAYQLLWAQIDVLAMLRAPDFATIVTWRQQQEHALRARAGPAPGVMDDAAVIRFVAHYERITRWMLHDLPGRADCVIDLDDYRRATRVALATEPGA